MRSERLKQGEVSCRGCGRRVRRGKGPGPPGTEVGRTEGVSREGAGSRVSVERVADE